MWYLVRPLQIDWREDEQAPYRLYTQKTTRIELACRRCGYYGQAAR